MRISDWSSDVCSSDLRDRSSASQSPVACHAQFLSAPGIAVIQPDAVHAAIAVGACKTHAVAPIVAIITVIAIAPATRAVIIHRPAHTDTIAAGQIGSASCRESVCQSV